MSWILPGKINGGTKICDYQPRPGGVFNRNQMSKRFFRVEELDNLPFGRVALGRGGTISYSDIYFAVNLKFVRWVASIFYQLNRLI